MLNPTKEIIILFVLLTENFKRVFVFFPRLIKAYVHYKINREGEICRTGGLVYLLVSITN